MKRAKAEQDPKPKAVSTARGKVPSKAKGRKASKRVAIQSNTKTKAKKAEPKKTGRPTSYTEELADRILNRIADGTPLKVICQEPGMPSRESVRRWTSAIPGFRALYAQAREEFAHSLVDELLPLADESREGRKTKSSDNGVEVTTGDMIERSRLQVETRKWLASKLLPKKYGDKLEVDNTGEVKHTITFRRGGKVITLGKDGGG